MECLDFGQANITPVSKEGILLKISEYDIFKMYCHNFVELETPFVSELRSSDTANCRITAKYNSLTYKDFKSGESYDCWNYVMNKFNCKYFEALNIISNDFNIRNGIIPVEPRIITANDEFKLKISNIPREKSIIQIVSQPFTIEDYNYWSKYSIPLIKLEEFDVFSAKTVFLIKGTKRTIFDYKKTNPCYAYRFTREGSHSYKIYWPLTKDKKFKWLFSGGSNLDLEGLDCLPLHGDLLVIGKSLKDVIILNLLGYSAISLQGEKNKLEQDTYNMLSKRFNEIISFYDNDSVGLEGANYLLNTYKIGMIFVPIETKCKDISDYVKLHNLDKGKKLMKQLLNG